MTSFAVEALFYVRAYLSGVGATNQEVVTNGYVPLPLLAAPAPGVLPRMLSDGLPREVDEVTSDGMMLSVVNIRPRSTMILGVSSARK